MLPRLAGADMTIYPSFHAGYAMSEEDCHSVAMHCRQSFGSLLSSMPALGGRMGVERIAELTMRLGREITVVIGSRIQQDPRGVVSAIEEVSAQLLG